MIRKVWPESRGGRILTLAAFAVLAAPAAYLLGFCSFIRDWLVPLWAFLAEDTLVPNWILVLLVICALIVCGLFGASLRPKRESIDPEKWE